MTDADDDALLRLVHAGGRNAPRRRLLEAHPSPEAALAAGASGWRACGLDPAPVQALRGGDTAALAHARAWLAQPGHHLIGWHDPDYPALLRRTARPPLALFVAGDPALLWHPAVAVVGSRNPSSGGRDHARDFAHAFAASGLAVASGLAAGIDTAAHAGALAAGGRTLAVVATGPDVPYPRSNAALHARICVEGAVVSEHLPGTAPLREHFPSRNRIIAGLALGTLVVEAAQRSGALITARLAAEAGREVFALPGSIDNPMARGCHRLIRDGAGLVERAQEVVDALAPSAMALGAALRQRLEASDALPPTGVAAVVPGAPRAPIGHVRAAPATPRTDLSDPDPDYHRLWQALGHDPTGMDRLAERSGLTPARLSAMLLAMELDGRVAVQHGRYSRKS